MQEARPAVVSTLFLMIVAGIAYPAAVALLARLPWARQAEGSLVLARGHLVGSELVGQVWSDPGHFWGRPSATTGTDGGPLPCNGALSGGSNLSPGNPSLAALVADRAAALRAAGPCPAGPIPAQLLLASGSGLDPHISPEAAAYQIPRVAWARRLDEASLRSLVRACTEPPQWGMFGEARVNVLRLNLALEGLGEKRP